MLKEKIIEVINSLLKKATIRNLKVKYVYQKMLRKLKEYDEEITSFDEISFIGPKTKEILKKQIHLEIDQSETKEKRKPKNDCNKIFSKLISDSEEKSLSEKNKNIFSEEQNEMKNLNLFECNNSSLLLNDSFNKTQTIILNSTPSFIHSFNEEKNISKNESFSVMNESIEIIKEEVKKLPNDILEEKISIKPKKVYIPSFRSGGYAILKVLSEEDGLTKSQISVRGKFYCDTEFNSKLQYSAFSSIKTLLKKKLVFTEGKPIKYFLTELGKEISQKLPQNNTVIEKEDKIKLLIDSREMKDKKSRDFFQKELEKEGLILETCNLEVGDFVWLKNDSVLDLIIERKKGSDFVSSITDGRLKEQMERLKNSGISKIFYLIEGLKSQDMNQNENFIKSVLSDIKKKEITVVETENINESIRFILQVDKYLKYTEIKEACTYEEFISKNVKNGNLNDKSFFKLALLSIKGMNLEKSNLISEKYKNLINFISFIKSNEIKKEDCFELFFMSHKQFEFVCKILGIKKEIK
ncbi:crossover junction endonuclease MUS81-like [Tubulinosema ratisbonensis]|uniref:Crossover junction endonuclease MUS81 n=1 Tax=Tubulinosema ratisbonensis TaxID=291195 RepID=A0A437ALK2_9MICR|nr:crossover junction endonuclease MUS81-like [Tubulinosema ratisbonensis]